MKDVNTVAKSDHFDTRKLSAFFAASLLIIMTCVSYLMITLSADSQSRFLLHTLFSVATATAITLYVSVFVLAVKIHKHLVSFEKTDRHSASSAKVILLTLAMYLSLPYLQSRMNTVHGN